MTIKLSYHNEFALITLSRPEALNALSFGIVAELGSALDRVAGEGTARALIITGAGEKAFCAGADITELKGRDLTAQQAGTARGQQTMAKLDDLPIPSVAAINGFAFGGGLELALACDLRIAGPRAKLGLPEIKLGLIPGYGGTQRLPRLIGEGRALEMIMTGRTVGAEEALAIGLVHRLASGNLVEEATAFAREVSCYSLPVLRFARRAVKRALDVPVHEGFKIESDLSTLAYQTADAEEGMNAFVEKRAARFEDK
ncbi:MAG: enoyl-CoA hydratase/isomerase family protein [Gammaproteobacteria bacterium]